MNKKILLCYFKYAVLFLFLANFALLVICTTTPWSQRGQATEANPAKFYNNKANWAEISDFAVCGRYLYLLFSDRNIMACYDLVGRYQHSYSFSMNSNGKAALLVVGDRLYVEGKPRNIYAFEDGQFSSFFHREHNSAEIEAIKQSSYDSSKKKQSADGTVYLLRNNSVWSISPCGTEREVIHRPIWSAFIQAKTLLFINLILLAANGFIHWKIKL